jgi:hypothetical protein
MPAATRKTAIPEIPAITTADSNRIAVGKAVAPSAVATADNMAATVTAELRWQQHLPTFSRK